MSPNIAHLHLSDGRMKCTTEKEMKESLKLLKRNRIYGNILKVVFVIVGGWIILWKDYKFKIFKIIIMKCKFVSSILRNNLSTILEVSYDMLI